MAKADYKRLYGRAHFLNVLQRDLERISATLDPSRVIRFALRRTGEMLGADLAFQSDVGRADGAPQPPYFISLVRPEKREAKKNAKQDGGKPPASGGAPSSVIPAREAERCFQACREFLRRATGPADRHLLLLRVTSEKRPAAVLGLQRGRRGFSRRETSFGQDVALILSENLGHRERERTLAVRERIYAKILSETRPQDVLYQILHGLKRLLQYDHGAAVRLLLPDGTLSLQAEIVAWTKAKSNRIGQRTPASPELEHWLSRAPHPVLLRGGEEDSEVPPCLLAPLRETNPGQPPVRAIIVGVLRHRDRALGCLEIRSTRAEALSEADLGTLRPFLPLASVTLYNSTLYKTQHDLLVTAERKTALADLARAISHDLNNAFGVILPLLQAMRRDLARGEILPEQFARDLEVIDHYTASSGRIFQGLLSVARGAAEKAGWSDLNTILESLLRMIEPNVEARNIRIRRELAENLPRLYLRRGEMEQLFLNLIYNARDAMPGGGELRVRTRATGGGIEVEVRDTGVGIPEQIRGRIFEPFFTTKASGSGLGLDICRSIVWDYDGTLRIDSTPGAGTEVTIWLPLLAERLSEEAALAAPPAAEPQAEGSA